MATLPGKPARLSLAPVAERQNPQVFGPQSGKSGAVRPHEPWNSSQKWVDSLPVAGAYVGLRVPEAACGRVGPGSMRHVVEQVHRTDAVSRTGHPTST